MKFGRREGIHCIVPIEVQGQKGEPLCLAYKTTTRFIMMGSSFSDDGYVLAPRGRPSSYYSLDAQQIATWQAKGVLPTPLPAYTLPWHAYAEGYLLWLTLGVGLLWALVVDRFRAARRRRLAALLRARPPSAGPPELRTAGDRFLYDEASKVLRSGERVQQQAYGFDRDARSAGLLGALASKGLFAVLTTERLLLVRTGGALRARLENRGLESIARGRIAVVRAAGDSLAFVLDDGSERAVCVRAGGVQFSNQQAFVLDVPRLLRSGRHYTSRQSFSVVEKY